MKNIHWYQIHRHLKHLLCSKNVLKKKIDVKLKLLKYLLSSSEGHYKHVLMEYILQMLF